MNHPYQSQDPETIHCRSRSPPMFKSFERALALSLQHHCFGPRTQIHGGNPFERSDSIWWWAQNLNPCAKSAIDEHPYEDLASCALYGWSGITVALGRSLPFYARSEDSWGLLRWFVTLCPSARWVTRFFCGRCGRRCGWSHLFRRRCLRPLMALFHGRGSSDIAELVMVMMVEHFRCFTWFTVVLRKVSIPRMDRCCEWGCRRAYTLTFLSFHLDTCTLRMILG